jgi:hypothetical protein
MTDHSATIRDHLTRQRAQAVTACGTCCYRFGTLKCAIGCLIHDEKYDPEFEGLVVFPLDAHPDHKPRLEQLHATLPADLNHEEAQWWQRYHDGCAQLGETAETAFSYVRWCDNDLPAQSPAAFYEALRVYMANKAEPDHGNA